MGLDHPLGLADGYGEMTPYVNMNVDRSLTWCFVIGREGGGRWACDPSRDDEEFLEAVRSALAEESPPPLPETVAARRALLARFPKTDAAKRVRKLDDAAKGDETFQQAVHAWKAWDELREAAPALFPARVDKQTRRYAKKMRAYVKQAEEGSPGLEHARKLLATFEDA